jgi:hypothetical protein
MGVVVVRAKRVAKGGGTDRWYCEWKGDKLCARLTLVDVPQKVTNAVESVEGERKSDEELAGYLGPSWEFCGLF